MRPWIKRTLIALLGFTVLAGALAAYGHRSHHDRLGQVTAEDVAQWRGKVLERAGEELELDAAQRQRLGVLFDKLDAQRSALMGGSADPRAAMQQLIAGERFDRAMASALVQEKIGAVSDKSPEVIAAAADFYDALDAPQQAKVREFMARHHGRGRS